MIGHIRADRTVHMIRTIGTILAIALYTLHAQAQQTNIIPEPLEYTSTGQTIDLAGQQDTLPGEIVVMTQPTGMGAASYILEIAPGRTTITAEDADGEHYARQTLQQLIDLAKYEGQPIPACTIKDKPRYAWRGLMIDPARYHWSVEDIEKYIELMSYYKYNKLHLHLTDDQGWRFPVPSYDRLQGIASKRSETAGDGKPHGGFYTREDMKRLVDFAAKHRIELIPEFSLPAHVQALAAAYPEMVCYPGDNIEVRTIPGKSKDLLCPSNEDVFRFYDALFNESKQLFPSPYIHIGGEEVPLENWNTCPNCVQYRKKYELAAPNDQLRHVTERMVTLLAQHGKKPLRWYNPSLGDSYAEGSIVYTADSNNATGTLKQAEAKKLLVICAPAEYASLDYPQQKNDCPDNKFSNILPIVPLEKTYSFDPGNGLSPEAQAHILGVEGTLWGEQIDTLSRALFMSYPRAFALSEAAWSPMNVRSWPHFEKKAKMHINLLSRKWKVDVSRPSGQ